MSQGFDDLPLNITNLLADCILPHRKLVKEKALPPFQMRITVYFSNSSFALFNTCKLASVPENPDESIASRNTSLLMRMEQEINKSQFSYYPGGATSKC